MPNTTGCVSICRQSFIARILSFIDYIRPLLLHVCILPPRVLRVKEKVESTGRSKIRGQGTTFAVLLPSTWYSCEAVWTFLSVVFCLSALSPTAEAVQAFPYKPFVYCVSPLYSFFGACLCWKERFRSSINVHLAILIHSLRARWRVWRRPEIRSFRSSSPLLAARSHSQAFVPLPYPLYSIAAVAKPAPGGIVMNVKIMFTNIEL